MKIHLIAVAAVVLAAGGLSACGGNSDFKAKAIAGCNKDGGKVDDVVVDCNCAGDILDADLDADTKKLVIAISNAQESGGDTAKAMKDAGIDMTNPDSQKKMIDMASKMEAENGKIKEKCKKS